MREVEKFTHDSRPNFIRAAIVSRAAATATGKNHALRAITESTFWQYISLTP